MGKEKAIQKAWDKLEAEIGIGPITEGDRKEIEEWANVPPFLDAQFAKDYLLDIDRFREVVEIVNRLREGGKERDSTMAKGRMGAKAVQIAAQRFQRRVEIAEFVLFNVYTKLELFVPLLEHKKISGKRIDWKKMLIAWNEAHPSDIMTSTHVFSSTFDRILREEEVLYEVLRRQYGIAIYKIKGGQVND